MVKLKIVTDKEDAPDIIKSAISSEIKRLEIGLNKTIWEINKLEEKYETSSKIFLEKFAAEDLKEGDEEYVKWMGELELHKRILEELGELRGIEYVIN